MLLPSRSRIVTRLVATSNPAPASSASFTTIRSSSFRSSLARPLGHRVSRLERKADDHGPRLPPLARGGQNIGRRLERDGEGAVFPAAAWPALQSLGR